MAKTKPLPAIGNPVGLVAPQPPLTPEQQAQAQANVHAQATVALLRERRPHPPDVGAAINTTTATPIGS